MTSEPNDNEIEIELDLKSLKNEIQTDLTLETPKASTETGKDEETPLVEDNSDQAKKAAKEKTAKEKKEAVKKAAKAKKAAAKKAAQAKKAAAKKAAQEKKKVQIELPAYFTTKYPDYQDEKKAEQEALCWFLGVDTDKKPLETSYSARITYVGPKHKVSKKIKAAKRAINPNFGNWKLFISTVRFFKGTESVILIKDPAFIKEALSTTNYKVRIVMDAKIQKESLKSKHFARDEAHILRMKPRLRRDMVASGLKPVMHKGEAKQFLEELDNNPKVRKDLYTAEQRKWLQNKIKEDET
jgi:hypothetical protein